MHWAWAWAWAWSLSWASSETAGWHHVSSMVSIQDDVTNHQMLRRSMVDHILYLEVIYSHHGLSFLTGWRNNISVSVRAWVWKGGIEHVALETETAIGLQCTCVKGGDEELLNLNHIYSKITYINTCMHIFICDIQHSRSPSASQNPITMYLFLCPIPTQQINSLPRIRARVQNSTFKIAWSYLLTHSHYALCSPHVTEKLGKNSKN
jgi:hypothetical protein